MSKEDKTELIVHRLEAIRGRRWQCWEWLWTLNRGYGFGKYKGKNKFAHRLSYELVKGEIPKGLELDHLCRNPKCVNPDHLEAVTRLVNQQRRYDYSIIPPIPQKPDRTPKNPWKVNKEGYCKQGHELTEENSLTWFDKKKQKTKRKCKICYKKREQERRTN